MFLCWKVNIVSYLPWWGWLACSLGAFAFSILAFILPNNLGRFGWTAALILLLALVLAGLCLGGMAFISFVT